MVPDFTQQEFNLLSPAVLRDPHEFWQSARPDAVFFYERIQCWVVTRRDDVARVLGDWKTFSSHTLRAAPLSVAAREHVPTDVQAIPPKLMSCAFINLDPPGHTVDRKNAQKAFTRPLVASTEPFIRQLARELIDGFASRDRCELMKEFSHPLALGVIGHMVGFPPASLPQFRNWIDDFFGLMEPARADDHSLAPADAVEARYAHIGEAWDFFKDFLDDRRSHPRDDLASRMVLARADDGTPAMSDEHILTHLLELAAAGSDTTANLIGHTVRLFTERPDLLDEVGQDPTLWDRVVEESLRRFAIVTNLMRVTTVDVYFGDVHIPAGSVSW